MTGVHTCAFRSMADLLSYSETQKLLDGMPRDQQKLVADLVPSQVSVSIIQRVLQSLLDEKVSIRDLTGILEAIQEGYGQGFKTVAALVAHVRIRLARQISSSVMNAQGYIPVLSLSPEWELAAYESLSTSIEEKQINFSPSQMQRFVSSLKYSFESSSKEGRIPVILTSRNLRLPLRRIVERIQPAVSVLSQEELFSRAKIINSGTIL